MRELLNRLYGSFADGDVSMWEHSLSDDVVMIGTDQAEWWQGLEHVLPVLRAQMEQLHGAGIELSPGDPQVGSNGDTVWAADQPTMHLGTGSDVALRLTLVATRDEGRLVFRQLHLSIGAPNEEVLGQTLTV
jgi:ketosteroid isomerase-like protein